jgi:histidyl-tRNA synthetase
MSALIKIPHGTQDYSGDTYDKLDYLKSTFTNLFKKYHAVFIETPVFELTHVLMDKYGDDEKLIYNIDSSDRSSVSDQTSALVSDQSTTDKYHDENKSSTKETSSSEIYKNNKLSDGSEKEKISLRYDHTIPLVRHCIANKINKMRRGCVGKVYRRETTTKTQFRLREFYQADFDYVGNYDELVPELELFCMIQELFTTLNIENYEILYNYRQNINYYVKESGIDVKFSSICSSIDKLDKKDKDYVRDELIEKGVLPEQIDKLFKFLCLGSDHPEYIFCPSVKELDKKFRSYMNLIKTLDLTKIKFVPILARGSDYYTGIIFEIKLTNSPLTSSLAGGGRYDKLIPSYRKSLNSNDSYPMIGIGFGLDRLIPLINIPNQPQVPKIWISTIGNLNNATAIKLDLVGRFSRKGYGCFYNLSQGDRARKFKKEISDASECGCNYIVIIGESELASGNVTIKNMMTREELTIPSNSIDDFFANTIV